MNKLLTVLATTVAMITPTFAADAGYDFYTNQSQNWHIGGYTGDPNLNPACYAEYVFQDGSVFQLIKDLEDGEVYVYLQNMAWNISDAPGEYSLRMNLTGRGGSINPASGNYYYNLINKNSISIRGLNVNQFIPDFMDAAELDLIMPGDIPNAYIPLDGSAQATAMLAECIDKSNQVNLDKSTSTDQVLPKINS